MIKQRFAAMLINFARSRNNLIDNVNRYRRRPGDGLFSSFLFRILNTSGSRIVSGNEMFQGGAR